LIPTGGTGTFTSTLYPSTGGSIGPVIGAFTGVAPGTYTIVSCDVNGCCTSTTFVITEPTKLLIDTLSVKDLTCFGGTDGYVHASAMGGTTSTLGYLYQLTKSGAPDTNRTGQFNTITAGIYTLSVIDANGCVTSTILSLSQPNTIAIDSVSVTDIICGGSNVGKISVYASGGVGALIYVNNTMPPDTNLNGFYVGLAAGIYTVNVSDSRGCSVSTAAIIFENPPIKYDSISMLPPACKGDNNGSIFINGSGGVGKLILSMDNVAYPNEFIYLQNIKAGNYHYVIQDSFGCTFDTVLVLKEPDVLAVSVNIIKENQCDGPFKVGEIQASTTGGTPAFTYILKPSLDFNAVGYFGGLGAGSYTVTAKDANGCTNYTEFNIINQFPQITLNANVTDVQCRSNGRDGKIEMNPSGGVAPYVYIWDIGINTNNNTLDSLHFGNYIVTVYDKLGCHNTDTITVNPANCCEVWMPTAFSPNEDNINNIFTAKTGADIDIFHYRIFDRWGNKVFETNDIAQGWDGKYKGQDMDNGNYFVYLTFKCKFDGQIYNKKLDVTIVR
jgi:gliding motility-associated-like protein